MKKSFFKSVVAVTVVAAGIIGSMPVSARQMWLHVNNQGVQREVCQVYGDLICFRYLILRVNWDSA